MEARIAGVAGRRERRSRPTPAASDGPGSGGIAACVGRERPGWGVGHSRQLPLPDGGRKNPPGGQGRGGPVSPRFGRPASWRALASLAAVVLTLSVVPAPGGAQPCSIQTVGLDTSQATTSGGAFLGEAPGQTFLARDTLTRSLTVWRMASEDTNLYGMHLYITETDSTGMPLTDHMVLDGPTLYNPYGDGIHPIPFQWVFDPPVALPRRGLYAFFLRMTPCVLGYFDVLARESAEDLYPEGHFWWTPRSANAGCVLLRAPYSNPAADMIFRMEFCSTTTVPVRRKTWGEIKVIYR